LGKSLWAATKGSLSRFNLKDNTKTTQLTADCPVKHYLVCDVPGSDVKKHLGAQVFNEKLIGFCVDLNLIPCPSGCRLDRFCAF
jgi:hypothetical protein